MNISNKIIPLFSMFFGAVFFFLIMGVSKLDPTNVTWLNHGDLAQHFLGWHFYRWDDWHFPITYYENFKYPVGTSLIFTDSIPLLGIFFKILSPFLPKVFQYQGLWILSCFMLQGYFAALLLQRFIHSKLLVILASCFFFIAPTMILKTLAHEALVAHWMILAAFYLYFKTDSKQQHFSWFLLIAIATMTHFYLLVMVYIIYFGNFINRWEIVKLWQFFLMLFSTLFLMFFLGYFEFGVASAYAGGFGHFSTNLLSFINPTPLDDLSFFSALPFATKGQYEGFAYLGFGMIVLLLLSLSQLNKAIIKNLYSSNKTLLGILFIFLFLAVTPRVTFGTHILFDFNFFFIEKPMNLLIRSSGRMIWPFYYMLILGIFYLLSKSNQARRINFLVLLTLLIQLVDFFPWWKSIHVGTAFNKKNSPPIVLELKLWGKIIESVQHVVFIPPEIKSDDYVQIAFLAASHQKTLNVAYVARRNKEQDEDYRESLMQSLKEKKFRRDTLYLFRNIDFVLPEDREKYIWGELEGYKFLAPKLR